MGLGSLNPGCNCLCNDCEIWLDNCHVRWRCSSDTVQVFRNGVLFSTQQSGSAYRPTPGLWELRACNGVGCTPVVVDSVNVPTLSTEQCPLPPNCCFEKQYARYQVPEFQYSATSQTSRDYRVLSLGQLVGRNLTTIRLHEYIDFPFGGSYLFPILSSSNCNFSVNVLLGTATLVSQGLISGTESRQQQNGSVLTCEYSAVTYAELPVEIWMKGASFWAKPTGGWWESTFRGHRWINGNPNTTECSQRYEIEPDIAEGQERSIARFNPQGSIVGLCEYSGQWNVGPGLGGAFNVLAYGIWPGNYRIISSGGTTFLSVAEDLIQRQGFPAVTPPSFNAGIGWFGYV